MRGSDPQVRTKQKYLLGYLHITKFAITSPSHGWLVLLGLDLVSQGNTVFFGDPYAMEMS
jgi:hypothetical protein